MVYGPFSDPNDRLACFEISDSATGTSRASKRKAVLQEKENDRANNDHSKRGFSTDQNISMEALKLQRLAHEQTTTESNLVALIAHEAALGRQIEAAERRAFIRCKEYDASNVFWQNCDSLINKQGEITNNIAKYTVMMKPATANITLNGDSEIKKTTVDLIGSDSESPYSPNKCTSPSLKKKATNKKQKNNTELVLLPSDSESDTSSGRSKRAGSEASGEKPKGISSPRKQKKVSNKK